MALEFQKSGAEFLVTTQALSEQYSPTVTGLVNGGFVVSWFDNAETIGDASGTSIKAQVFTAAGAKVGSEFLINTQTANGQRQPTITGLTNGGFVVSWFDRSGTLGDNSGVSIKAQIYAPVEVLMEGANNFTGTSANDRFDAPLSIFDRTIYVANEDEQVLERWIGQLEQHPGRQ